MSAQEVGERRRGGAILPEQAEWRIGHGNRFHHGGGRAACVLQPSDDHRGPRRRQDEQRLLEARLEPGEVRHVREVLAVGIDDDRRRTSGAGTLPQPIEPHPVQRVIEVGKGLGDPELRQVNVRQANRRHCDLQQPDRPKSGPTGGGIEAARRPERTDAHRRHAGGRAR